MKTVARLIYGSLAVIALQSQSIANGNARILRYVGMREIVTGVDTRVPRSTLSDNRFSIVDDVTWTQAGADVDRVDDLDFTLVGPDSSELNPAFGSTIPEVEKRTDRERHVRIGSRDVIEITKRSDTTDQQPPSNLSRTMGISQDYMLTTVFARPQITLAFSGTPFTFTNSRQRNIFQGPASGPLVTSVARDGAITENLYSTTRFTQAADGSAHFNAGIPGFYSNDLVVDAPTETGGVRTIHSLRTSSGRTIGAYPVTKVDVTVPDWYPGGVPGSSDTLRVVGVAQMPGTCERPLGKSLGFESLETLSETRATGEITTETIRSFTHGSTILCTSDERMVRTFDTATGTLAKTSTDTEVLHLSSTPPHISVSLVADHEPTFGFGADRHAVGAPVLTIGVRETKTVALRLTPASIDGDPSATLTVKPAIASASLGRQGSISVEAYSDPGNAVLTVRSPKAGGSASIPIQIYRRVDLGCDNRDSSMIAFDKDGEIVDEGDAVNADIRIDCLTNTGDRTIFFPLGATAIHTGRFDVDTFASLQPSAWNASVFSLDASSAFAGFLRIPGNDHDEAQDILLLKTHRGQIVKLLCARRAAFSLHGIYAVAP